MRRFALVALLPLAACEIWPPTGLGGSVLDSGTLDTGDTATEPATTSETSTTVPTGSSSPGRDGWSFFEHPCFGNRTDTLWLDDPDTLWVGCGSTTEGTGLFLSEDGGRSWGAPATVPPAAFSTFRVSSVSRSADGLLYVAGTDTVGAARVLSMDPRGNVAEVFAAGNQTWNAFQVGTFRRNAEGVAVAESLMSSGLVARFEDGAEFEDASAMTVGHQVLDLVLFEDRFYGVGSTIGQPPTLFLPPAAGLDPAQGFRFDVVELAADGPGAFDGELWGVAVDEGGLLAAGVNQDGARGVIVWSSADPSDLDGYHLLDLAVKYGEPTWMRGACRDGATLMAVGEYSRRGDGLVLRSEDGGASWVDVTPAGLPPVQRCAILPDGGWVIAGAEGMLARYAPSH